MKPGFFTNEQLADLSPLTRLLFAGLWLQADKAGRLEDRPRKLKAEILPYDECNVDDLLAQLARAGFIQRYSIDSRGYISILAFHKHQHPHPKEPNSVIPEPCKEMVSTLQGPEIPEPERLFLPHANTPSPNTPTTDSVGVPWGDDFPERGIPTEPLVKAIARACKQDIDRCGERVVIRISRCADELCRLEPDLSRQALALLVDDFGPWHESGNLNHPVPAPEWIADKWGPFKAWKLTGAARVRSRTDELLDEQERLYESYGNPTTKDEPLH